MGILDQLGGSLKSALGAAAAAEGPGLISAALAKANMGDLQGLVTQLQQGGLGDQVKSWLGNGANLPVTAEQLQSVLNNDQVKQLANHLGVPVDQALQLLAQHLPTVIDQASPNGAISR